MIDTSRPHPARIYDYLLGGKDNYEVDELAGDELVATTPGVRMSARANRAFLQRAVRYVVQCGIRQILDIGAGLPNSPNVHEIAHTVAPHARVAYIDNDPIVKAHADALLRTSDTISTALADLRDPQSIVRHPDIRQVIDFDEPIALILGAVLHFVTDAEQPQRLVATLRNVLPAGSFLVLSHATADFADSTRARAVYDRATATLNPRPRAEVQQFFTGFELVEPGLTQAPLWRPDAPTSARPGQVGIYGGVAHKAH
ncbi:SAM-dependent methyltransferase (plasmid) [Streptomyces sp. NBC_00445]|uniref:SAM-dependent methyltransferase n=1 Tax=Streptomyces sp. NBC_00445 TaxID=2975745 RepID=UPI002E1EC356